LLIGRLQFLDVEGLLGDVTQVGVNLFADRIITAQQREQTQ
jgi:hypothetical protein